MLLTPAQLLEIQKIIEDHHDAFIVNAIGEEAVSPEVLEALKAKGLIDPKVTSIKDSYVYGQLMGMLENKVTAKMSFPDFKNHVAKNPVPLSPIERGAMQMSIMHAGQYCKGLGNTVSKDTGEILIEADQKLRASLETDIRDATAENIAKRETIQQLKTDLGWKTKDWARDLKRIAVTEKNNAMQHGTADHFRKRHGPDVWVFKRALPGACQHCIRLHTGKDGQPRIYKLSVLEDNGTNVGRKAADWRAVVGVTHPNCSCILGRVPEGWGFDEEGDLVPGGKLGEKYETGEKLALALLQENDLLKAQPTTEDSKLQGKVSYQGMTIAIENEKGSTRGWTDADGNKGQTTMEVAYGYVEGTEGMDGDEIDVFLGSVMDAANIYVIEQGDPHTGRYDEVKCMMGFENEKDAVECYRRHYDPPDDYFLDVTPMPVDQFKRWIQETKPKAGNMFKSKGPQLVLPLEKSLDASSGASTSPAGNRAPGPGLGINYVIFVPEKRKPNEIKDTGYSPDITEILQDKAECAEGALHVNPEVYNFMEPMRYVRPIEIPDDMVELNELAREDLEINREWLERYYSSLLGEPNVAQIKTKEPRGAESRDDPDSDTDSDSDTLPDPKKKVVRTPVLKKP